MSHRSRQLELAFLAEDTKINRFIWAAMAFQSGIINVGAFFVSKKFVTHMTGFATQFGADFALKHWHEALSMITIPIFFLIGAMVSGFYIDREVDRGRDAKYRQVFLYITVLVLLTAYSDLFRLFENDKLDELMGINQIFLISFLCMAAGMQNAAIATASKRIVRTTHLTGITTDLGVGIIRAFHSNNVNEKKANQVRIILIGSFILGAATGASISAQINHVVFFIPAMISLAIYSYIRKREKNIAPVESQAQA